jgi:hypothetical protein
MALQRKGMEIYTFLPIADWQFCLASYWLLASLPGFSSQLGFPIGIPYSLGIA